MWSVLGVFLPTRVLQVNDSGTKRKRGQRLFSVLCIPTAQLIEFVTVLRCRFSVTHLEMLF